MNSKFSLLAFEDVSKYLSFVTEDDRSEVELYLMAAKSFVKTHSGLTIEELDAQEYFVMPVLMLVSSFWENKSVEMDKNLSSVYIGLLNLGTVHSL